MSILSAIMLLSQPVTAAGGPPPPVAAPAQSDTRFGALGLMVGTWRPADEPDSPLRIEFYLTARGTVLVESWEVRGKPHSLTIYHRDGADLLATHYCPQGNQPRLVAPGDAGRRLHFIFRDATDLDPATESHQHELWFDLADAERPVRGEVYRSNGTPGMPEEMRLVRVIEAPADLGERAAR